MKTTRRMPIMLAISGARGRGGVEQREGGAHEEDQHECDRGEGDHSDEQGLADERPDTRADLLPELARRGDASEYSARNRHVSRPVRMIETRATSRESPTLGRTVALVARKRAGMFSSSRSEGALSEAGSASRA